METLEEVKTNKITENNAKTLADATIKTINQINDYVEFNEYQYNVNPVFLNENEIRGEIMNLSLNQRKKLKRSINAFRIKDSLSSVNRFYHFLMTKVLMSDVRIKITYSKKYLKIQEKRQAYLKLFAEVEKARNEYKDEKGDYFKSRIIKGQKTQ